MSKATSSHRKQLNSRRFWLSFAAQFVLPTTCSVLSREQLESKYYSLTSSIDEVLQKLSETKHNGALLDSSNTSTWQNNMQSQLLQGHLPIITIPMFDGSYDDWVEFKDAFVSIIDSNTVLTDVQKLFHLNTI